jgi:hypothetical protein
LQSGDWNVGGAKLYTLFITGIYRNAMTYFTKISSTMSALSTK